VLVRARNEEILASMQKNEKSASETTTTTFTTTASATTTATVNNTASAATTATVNMTASAATTATATTTATAATSASRTVDFEETVKEEKIETQKLLTNNEETDSDNSDAPVKVSGDTSDEAVEIFGDESDAPDKVSGDASDTTIEASDYDTDAHVEASVDATEAPVDAIDAPAEGLRDAPFVDEEIELTFDMTKTKLAEITTIRDDSDETLEDTYASLGVTFLELTSQMQNVLKEVTTTSNEAFKTTSENDKNGVDTSVDKDDLPFIDDADGDDAELDAAIEAAAPDLDHEDHVTSIQVNCQVIANYF
jgi:hypothetical protein